MRETTKPKAVKYSSLTWLVGFLNLRFDSKTTRDQKKVEALLAGEWPQDHLEVAAEVQQKMIDLCDLAIKAESPEGLVWGLNNYVAYNSESFDPRRQYPPVRAHWYARPLINVPYRDHSQAVLKMGSRKWIVQNAPLMHGTEGRVWLSIAQCMVNGDLGRVRRCLQCRLFFITDDARRRFCKSKHQREYDAEASKARVKLSREATKAKAQGLKLSKAKKEPPAVVTDVQRFGDFIEMARGNVVYGSDLALFIKRKIPGDWKTVTPWLKSKRSPDDIWTSIDERTKNIFRVEWGVG